MSLNGVTHHFEIIFGHNKVKVDRKRVAKYVPPVGLEIRVQRRADFVYLKLGEKMLEMSTPAAVKIGLGLCDCAGQCMVSGDIVQLLVNGEEFLLLPAVAVQIGGVICKKADRVDDYQRGPNFQVPQPTLLSPN